MPRPSRWSEVVDAAARLFRERGYHGTSLEDIAQEVGMLKGSLYHYIETKEDLLLAVVRPTAERLLSDLRELADIDLPAPEKIRRLVRLQALVVEEQLPYLAVYVNEIAGHQRSPEWAAMDREYVSLIDKIIREGVEQGAFEVGQPGRLIALAMIGSVNWMARWFRPDGTRSATEIGDELATLFLRGLLARRQEPRSPGPRGSGPRGTGAKR